MSKEVFERAMALKLLSSGIFGKTFMRIRYISMISKSEELAMILQYARAHPSLREIRAFTLPPAVLGKKPARLYYVTILRTLLAGNNAP